VGVPHERGQSATGGAEKGVNMLLQWRRSAEPGGQPNQSVSGDESGGDEKLCACVRDFIIIMTEIVRET